MIEKIIAITIGFLAILFMAFRKGEKSGNDKIINQQNKDELNHVRQNNKIEDYVNNLDDATITQQLQDQFGRKD